MLQNFYARNLRLITIS